uniref:tumor protein p63-regulated gene 1-like protein n=1 Tax=Pristiophorus japonicus TaxID=55135 RepID=UPI00398F8D19
MAARDPSEFQAVDLSCEAGDRAPGARVEPEPEPELELEPEQEQEPRLELMVQSGAAAELQGAGTGARAPAHGQIAADTPAPAPAHQDYRLRKFFVLRAGTFDQAIADIKAQINQQVDGALKSYWLLTEIDHWNNEKERIVLITDRSLLICKYDFMMLMYEHCRRVPLNYIDRICAGPFAFPERSITRREGHGLRVHWDKLREASFFTRWNPWSDEIPYTTFAEHPVKGTTATFTSICQLQNFNAQLVAAVQSAYEVAPVAGRANGAIILQRPIPIDTYVGVVSLLSNQNKLGYSLARGSVGF